MLKHHYLFASLLLVAFFYITACQPNSQQSADTTAAGPTSIWIDESLQPILSAEISAFQQLQPEYPLTATYAPAGDVLAALMSGKTKVIATGRPLDPAETQEFKKAKGYEPQTLWFCTEGMVLLVHPSNPDSNLTLQQLEDIFTGKAIRWSALNGNNRPNDSIRIMLENTRSSLLSFARDSLANGKPMTQRLYGVKGIDGVLKAISQNKQAIGLLPYNWIGDNPDAALKTLLSQVKMVGVRKESWSKAYIRMFPEKYALGFLMHSDSSKRYPLKRRCYLINADPGNGSESRFASFLGGEKGQKILYQSSIIPTTGLIRIEERTVSIEPSPEPSIEKR
jgi:phosphate transport system substrate-binding protein